MPLRDVAALLEEPLMLSLGEDGEWPSPVKTGASVFGIRAGVPSRAAHAPLNTQEHRVPATRTSSRGG